MPDISYEFSFYLDGQPWPERVEKRGELAALAFHLTSPSARVCASLDARPMTSLLRDGELVALAREVNAYTNGAYPDAAAVNAARDRMQAKVNAFLARRASRSEPTRDGLVREAA